MTYKLYVLGLCLVTFIIPFIFSRRCDMRIQWESKIRPPNYVFGLVWTILYACLAVSLYRLLTGLYGSDSSKLFLSMTVLLTIASYVLNYTYIYFSGCKQDWTTALRVMMAYLVILFPQMMMTFEVDSVAGILISPTVGWGVIALILNSFYISE
jgi:translocator protein